MTKFTLNKKRSKRHSTSRLSYSHQQDKLKKDFDGSEYIKHLENQLKKAGVIKEDGVNSGATNCYVFHGHGL